MVALLPGYRYDFACPSFPQALIPGERLSGQWPGKARSHATARKAAIDAAAASWTLDRREGRPRAASDIAWPGEPDLVCAVGYGPACAGRASARLSPALTPGQRRRRRRLDLNTAGFGNADRGAVCPVP